MNVSIAYGRGHLGVTLPDGLTTVIEPTHRESLPDERGGLRSALDAPIAAPPLRDWLRPGAQVCIVFTDITRPTPNDRLIPWLLEYLADVGVPREAITLLNSTGTHRPNTMAELEVMLTPEIVRDYRVINHECEKTEDLAPFGQTKTGAPVLIHRALAEADVRIITGFIEPHFFAGFSGGPKGIMPGCAGLETVMSNHGAHHIADPNAAFGINEGNPIWEEMRDIALRVGPSFLINVTLNERKQITGVFAGDLLQAHRAGAEFVRATAMQPVSDLFDIVVTSNSGYPLDMNLYQGVKGMSAAARIVQPGGLIILACECSDGVPDGSPFDHLLSETSSPEESWPSSPSPALSAPNNGRRRSSRWSANVPASSFTRISRPNPSAPHTSRRARILPAP